MHKFVHEQNLLRYQKLIDQEIDGPRRQLLLKLLGEETAKDQEPHTRKEVG